MVLQKSDGRTSEESCSPTQPFIEQQVPLEATSLAPPRHRLTWIIHIAAFSISLSLVLIAFTKEPSALQCTRQLSPYSPLIEDGLIKYDSKDFENEFEKPSNYRGQPSNLTEASWKALWETPAIGVPRDKLELLNKSGPGSLFPAPPASDDSAGDTFAALVEVFHQLHCINTLRLEVHKNSYYDHFGQWPDGSGPGNEAVKKTHIDHCIELLRITLMCTSDVTPLMFIDDPHAFQGRTPDFNTMHMCRNFWEIREWVENMGLPPLS
ncbi:hypothetical protein BDV38DRAFT_281417 [Aspergillus pseudotamarii]|uniref:Tat pathway signal sequence n=1 Tax=Aspergillus pseudotamarii TaxID=132259 RepID=A0A5N6SXB7_ASPPS|nr:uncharacterized protein BDV38DRAFT_281417 [Aspergillus pseudotamarii]KAE8139252.1 hypothetical protein BDV38DRAFT_281417 [Aspergillus pseudotamarii]